MMDTKNILLPPHVRAMLDKDTDDLEQQTDGMKARQLPDPVGYKMLLILPEQNDAFDSGILKADSTRKADEVSSVVAFVAKLGPDCYKDKAKFPEGPWCKQGDFVIIRPYSGVRIVVYGKEMRLVNDDAIEAVVEDPRGIKRVGA